MRTFWEDSLLDLSSLTSVPMVARLQAVSLTSLESVGLNCLFQELQVK